MSTDSLRVVVPARRDSLGVLRMMAGDAGNRSGFAYDLIEDARLAVNEAAALFISDGTISTLSCELRTGDGRLELELTPVPEPSTWPPGDWADSLGHAVLSAVTDSLELGDEGHRSIRMSIARS